MQDDCDRHWPVCYVFCVALWDWLDFYVAQEWTTLTLWAWLWHCLCSDIHFEHTFLPWVTYGWTIFDRGRTYILYAASFSCLFCVLTFRLMNIRLFLALFVIVFMWDDQLRLLQIVTPIYFAFPVVLRVVSWSVYRKLTDFFFSMYSENFTLVRVKFHWQLFSPNY